MSPIDNDSTKRLLPPAGGAAVRFYRVGHGDCFLVAFEGEMNKPIYFLIDCGYKPGSPEYIDTKIDEIVEDIRHATGGRVDVAVITHEHQDHVNGISDKRFKDIEIGETWFAWTEDPEDNLANQLRDAYRDKILKLLGVRNQLAADAGAANRVEYIDRFLEFELGCDENVPFNESPFAANEDPLKESSNKKSMKVWKDKAQDVRYIRPHEEILRPAGGKDVRVYALGPPRDVDVLKDLDPQGDEQFMGLGSPQNEAGAPTLGKTHPTPPFARRYCLPQEQVFDDTRFQAFFKKFYGQNGSCQDDGTGTSGEVPSNAPWRRIDKDWLFSPEQLALAMNSYTNNASLVLAFELGKGGKVLLFAADAQRGNWLSWADGEWKDGETKVKAKDLLARTVLYKVGHHGSHNATLKGSLDGKYPSLAWMAQDEHSSEFTAMITAVRAWADTQKGWDHPQKAIKDALLEKTRGRVFQTDINFDDMKPSKEVSKAEWEQFRSRCSGTRLYFDYLIHPSGKIKRRKREIRRL